MPAIYWAYWNRTPYQIAALGEPVFHLEYSRMLDKPGSNVTEIFVPRRQYRNGCSVTVEGGVQLPSDDVQAVLVENGLRATTVKVKITPVV